LVTSTKDYHHGGYKGEEKELDSFGVQKGRGTELWGLEKRGCLCENRRKRMVKAYANRPRVGAKRVVKHNNPVRGKGRIDD